LRRAESADVVIQAQVLWAQVESLGILNTETTTSLPVTYFGVGMKAGSRQTNPIDVTSFLRIVQEVRSIALVDRSPSAPPLMQNLGKYGAASQVEAKAKLYPTGGAIAEALAHSEVDLGITTMSELMSAPGVVVLGVTPPEILSVKINNTAAATKNASAAHEARAFLQFLRSPGAISVFKAKGFDPI